MKAYFLRRLGQPLILSDLPSLDLGQGEEAELDLYASAPLCDTDRRFVSLFLRSEAAAVVRLWIQDKRYFPRLIASAIVFLLAYILASFLIRDPLPMIDELVIGLFAAAGAWALIARQDAKTSVAREKQRKLETRISTAEVLTDPSLKDLEELYEGLYSYDITALAEKLVNGGLPPIEASEDIKKAALCYLRAHDKEMLKDVEGLKAGKRKEKTEADLIHLASTASLDLYATAFFYLLLS